jgi:hypothetical protein
VLHIVPLAQVAWSDGGMTQHERDLILEIAASRGIAEGSEAHRKLVDWLEQRPSEEFFAKSLMVAGVLAKARGEGTTPTDLVDYCTRVAESSGGILGLGGKISQEERDLIARIAAEFERAHARAAQEVVDKV